MIGPENDPLEDAGGMILRYLDGTLPPKQVANLNVRLKADAAFRQRFAELLLQENHLSDLGKDMRSNSLVETDGAIRVTGEQSVEAPGTLPFPEEFTRRTPWARPAVWALAASIVLLVGLGVRYFGTTSGTPTLLVAADSRVVLQRGTEQIEVRNPMALLPGDVVRNAGAGAVAITYGIENTRVEIQSGTTLKMIDWKKGKQFDLPVGTVKATVARQRWFRPMVVRTVQAEARVLGTKFTLAVTPSATRLEVTEGTVRLTRSTDGVSTNVPAGNYAVARGNSDLAALPLPGGIFREYWTNINGSTLLDFITQSKYPDRPDGTGYLTNLSSFELPSNQGDNYGERLRGYVHPPTSGEYTFWIAAKDSASLWLSPDDSPGNKLHMAHSEGAAPADWESGGGQISGAVPLVAGESYYFEVLHKAGAGDDNLALAWQGPGREREVIPIKFLAPFKPGK